MVQPFQDAVETLVVGQVSAPVQTQFGWHVIRLNDTREQAAPPLEEVRAQLTEQIQQQAIAEVLEALSGAGQVDTSPGQGLDPALLTNSALLED